MASRTAWPRLARLSRAAHSTVRAAPRRLRPAALDRPAMGPWMAVRFAHNIPRPRQVDDGSGSGSGSGGGSSEPADSSSDAGARGLAPHYELTFTCVPCGARSSHKVSKQGYHQGSVLITCPSCRNRHVITDHLRLFGGAQSLEDIVRERGQLVKRGTLGEDGDIEFWEDGTESRREERLAAEAVVQPVRREGEVEGGGEGAAPGSTFRKGGE